MKIEKNQKILKTVCIVTSFALLLSMLIPTMVLAEEHKYEVKAVEPGRIITKSSSISWTLTTYEYSGAINLHFLWGSNMNFSLSTYNEDGDALCKISVEKNTEYTLSLIFTGDYVGTGLTDYSIYNGALVADNPHSYILSKDVIHAWTYLSYKINNNLKLVEIIAVNKATGETVDLIGSNSENPGTPPPAVDKPSEWAEELVCAAIDEGIVPEHLQSKYQQATTRAEFCALAVALYEKMTGGPITQRQTFIDTDDVNVEKMAALGVVKWVGDNLFAPNSPLTREQAATMISRLADAIGKPLEQQAATFADNNAISDWALAAVGQMQKSAIMGGVGNNTFAPKSDYTREQSIVTMLRLYNIVK